MSEIFFDPMNIARPLKKVPSEFAMLTALNDEIRSAPSAARLVSQIFNNRFVVVLRPDNEDSVPDPNVSGIVLPFQEIHFEPNIRPLVTRRWEKTTSRDTDTFSYILSPKDADELPCIVASPDKIVVALGLSILRQLRAGRMDAMSTELYKYIIALSESISREWAFPLQIKLGEWTTPLEQLARIVPVVQRPKSPTK